MDEAQTTLNVATPMRHETKPWTAREIRVMRENASLGADVLAQMLQRSVMSVRSAAKRHQVSLRRPGERRGLALGQPRGERWASEEREVTEAARRAAILRELRTEIIDGNIVPSDVLSYVRGIVADRPLCPSCARAPQEARYGLCRACYVDGLTAAYIQRKREEDARRENDRERQRRNVAVRGTWRQRRKEAGK